MTTASHQVDPAITDRDHVEGRRLPAITDEFMRGRMAEVGSYTLVLLLKTASFDPSEHAALVMEHGRRNMALQADGVLVAVFAGGSEPLFAGVGVFDASPDEVTRIVDADPGVQAGIFSYEIHPVRGFFAPASPA